MTAASLSVDLQGFFPQCFGTGVIARFCAGCSQVQEATGVARIVRIAIPTELLALSEHRLDLIVLLTVLATAGLAVVPALYLGQRVARRLQRMVGFSRAVAAGDLAARLSVTRRDELGELEDSLDEMGRQLRMWLRGMEAESDKIRGIIGAMVEGLVVISPAGDVVLMNRRAEEIFALDDTNDYRGRLLIELCRDPELQSLVHEAMTTGARVSSREIALAGAARRHLAVSMAPLGDRQGFVLVFHDISEIKRLEAMRRDFVANVSHELRTPLTAIRGYAETLLGGALDDAARARQFVGVIDRHSERLNNLPRRNGRRQSSSHRAQLTSRRSVTPNRVPH